MLPDHEVGGFFSSPALFHCFLTCGEAHKSSLESEPTNLTSQSKAFYNDPTVLAKTAVKTLDKAALSKRA